jgi:putative hydrolase of the HAD superfamily
VEAEAAGSLYPFSAKPLLCLLRTYGATGIAMKVDAVLFDLFNTLVLIENDDVFYLPSLKKLHRFLVENGVEVAFPDFKRVYFEVRDRLYAEAERNLEEPHFNVRISQTLQRLGYDFDADHPVVVGATEAFCREFMRYMRLDDDAIYVLKKLHGKYKLGVVSNFALPECVAKIFEKFGLKGLFEVVIISGSINKRKPSAEVFEKALKALGVSASRAVFVGDMPALDVKGARNAGMRSVLIKRETAPPADSISLVYNPPEEDTRVEPDNVIESLTELLCLFDDC